MADDTPSGAPPEHPEHAPTEGNLSAAASHVEAGARQALAETGLGSEGPSLATAILVGTGVAIVEPEFIPGMLIGAGAWLAPKLLPAVGRMFRPVVKGIVKAGYSATMAARQTFAEATEQVEDIVAEARSEYETEHAAPAPNNISAAGTPRRARRAPRNPLPATGV